MSDTPVQKYRHTAITAGRLLTIMAARTSDTLGSFSSWLIGSVAAVLGLLLANVETVSRFVPTEALRSAIAFFLIAVVCHVLQRYLAAVVASSVAAALEAEKLPSDRPLDVEEFIAEIQRSTFWPARVVANRILSRIKAGDYAASGRLMAKLAQIQGMLVMLQMVLVVWSTWVIARTL